MAGPWEAFSEEKPAAKPWETYATEEKPGRGLIDQALGLTGERVKTWPERAVREALTLPKRMIDAAYSAPAGSREATEAMIPVAAETALTMSPVNPAIRAGDKIIPGAAKAFQAEKVAVPTTQELAKAGGADIRAATASDLNIPASAIANYSQKIQAEFSKPGSSIHPVDAPNTFAKLKELEGASSDAFFTPANLQSLRESLQATAQNFNPNAAKDQLAASRAIKALDEFLPSLGAKDTMAGAAPGSIATKEQLIASAMEGKREAERVAGLFERGRGNYAAGQRSNDITGILDRANTGILERAETRAQAANSGRNIDNTIRSKVASVLERPKEVSGLSDKELAALNSVVEGGAGRNTARYIANLMGGGGGIGQTGVAAIGAGIGGTVGGIPGALIGGGLPTAIGSGAKAIANALAKRDLRSVDELLRKRSPLFKERMENAEMMPVSAESRAAAARFIAQALLAQENQGAR
jgi:hypothetical protein